MKLQKSITGFIVAGIFVVLAIWALCWHLYSVKTNVADSGESSIVLLPFCLPWILMVPKSVAYSRLWGALAYVFYLLFVFINAFILYALAGGVRIRK